MLKVTALGAVGCRPKVTSTAAPPLTVHTSIYSWQHSHPLNVRFLNLNPTIDPVLQEIWILF